MRQWTRWCRVVAAVCLMAAPAWAQSGGMTTDAVTATHTAVTPDMLLNAQQSGNWLMYGGSYWNQRYSPLNKITTSNVGQLVPRMVFQTGIERLGSFENTPIVVNGIMYATTPYNVAMAYDLRTGKELWRYEHKLGTTIYCCGPNNRGVAIAHGMVYMATLDAQLVALDQTNGRVKWVTQIADPAFGYSETMAPLVIDNLVLIGTSGAEYGIRGFVKAYNANTGQLVWTWHTIPSPEEGGWWGRWAATTPEGENLNRDIAKEKADSARHADAWQHGGGSVWMTPAYDAESGLLFITIGNPSPDLDGSVRPGDNLWTESVVALEAKTGKFRWGYQTVPHDVWDLDAVSPVAITMLGGRKVAVHAGKTGWVYVLDAMTGQLVRRSVNVVPHENLFAQPTAEGTRMLPGANGGQEWSPIAVDPTLNYAFTAMLHQPMHYKVHYAPWEKGKLWLGSAFVAIPGERQWGNVAAVNLADGKIVWEVRTEQPMIGGTTATAGGLVFTGEGNGWFKAYDSKTGKVLWQFYCGAGVNSAPSVFEVDGEQFIAVAAGGNFQLGYPLGDAIFVFGLPKAAM